MAVASRLDGEVIPNPCYDTNPRMGQGLVVEQGVWTLISDFVRYAAIGIWKFRFLNCHRVPR